MAAGFRTVGTVQFAAAHRRPALARELVDAGAVAVIDDWSQLQALLAGR